MVKNPNGRMPTSWLFTSLAEDLNSELLRTNPATSIQGWDMRPPNYKSSTLTTWPCYVPPYASRIKVMQLKHLLFK